MRVSISASSTSWRPTTNSSSAVSQQFVVTPASVGVVVGPLPRGDRPDQPVPQVGEREDSALRDCHSRAEGAAFPGRIEDEFTVAARRCLRTRHVRAQNHVSAHAATCGVPANRTPIIASRVTSAVSSDSVMCSVPSGRCGSTM